MQHNKTHKQQKTDKPTKQPYTKTKNKKRENNT